MDSGRKDQIRSLRSYEINDRWKDKVEVFKLKRKTKKNSKECFYPWQKKCSEIQAGVKT